MLIRVELNFPGCFCSLPEGGISGDLRSNSVLRGHILDTVVLDLGPGADHIHPPHPHKVVHTPPIAQPCCILENEPDSLAHSMILSGIESNFVTVGLLRNSLTFLSTSGSLSDGDINVHLFGGITSGTANLG